jgi:myosin heavy subunit
MPFNKVRDRVYIRDERFEWLPAIVRKIVDNRILVDVVIPDTWNESTVLVDPNEEFPKKERRWVDLKDYYNHCLPPQNARHCRDLADLEHLHEAAILYTIKQRHFECQPYTRVGEIIIAVNPCQWIHSLYTKEEQLFYIHKFANLTTSEGKYTPCNPKASQF